MMGQKILPPGFAVTKLGQGIADFQTMLPGEKHGRVYTSPMYTEDTVAEEAWNMATKMAMKNVFNSGHVRWHSNPDGLQVGVGSVGFCVRGGKYEVVSGYDTVYQGEDFEKAHKTFIWYSLLEIAL
jgi:hypothetical protein